MTAQSAAAANALSSLWPGPAATPLLDCPEIAVRCGVGRILIKDERARPLGNFKSLGGVLAGLRALMRAIGASSIEAVLERRDAVSALTLVCASDGNHGLAVAAAAELAGAAADIYLHEGVSPIRARRLTDRGARIFRVPGTYDDAVDAAKQAADRPGALLVADTSDDPEDIVTADILEGYDHLVAELVDQMAALADVGLTHAFIQAGVGGLAAAVARGLAERLVSPPRMIAVEPLTAMCVEAGLASGAAVRVPGNLETQAEMLSCGQASLPALEILRGVGAQTIGVDDTDLEAAVSMLAFPGGLATTPSGAAGLAGVLVACGDSAVSGALALAADSRILLIVTEGVAPSQ
jgi:diaminopropionate ammonia-lyase